MDQAVEELVAAVVDAFRTAPLPPQRFKNETSMEAVLLPSMGRVLRPLEIEVVSKSARRVACFIPEETRKPDGEARQRDLAVAIELKLLHGESKDGGELHRGVGQCFTYVASPLFKAALLLVVHQCARRSLTVPTEMLGLRSNPFRGVVIADRWHEPSAQ